MSVLKGGNFMFIVSEIQTNNGTSAVLTDVFTDESLANQKYYTILAYATVSDIDVHAAAMFNEYGGMLKNDCFIHNSTPTQE